MQQTCTCHCAYVIKQCNAVFSNGWFQVFLQNSPQYVLPIWDVFFRVYLMSLPHVWFQGFSQSCKGWFTNTLKYCASLHITHPWKGLFQVVLYDVYGTSQCVAPVLLNPLLKIIKDSVHYFCTPLCLADVCRSICTKDSCLCLIHVFSFWHFDFCTGPGLRVRQTVLSPLKTKLRMMLWCQTLLFIVTDPLQASFDWHCFSVCSTSKCRI